MGLFNKDGSIKPFKQVIDETRTRAARDKEPDRTLKLFATKIPADDLEKFNRAVKISGEKIQTLVRNWMREYSEKYLKK